MKIFILGSFVISTVAFIATNTVALATPNFGELVMTGPDSAKILYQDTCSNGGNIGENLTKREEFLKKMLANPRSKLARVKAQLLKEIGDDAQGEGVYLGALIDTFHERDGCAASLNSFSFLLLTVTGGNSNHTVARFLVTVDDDDRMGVRTLLVRSIQAVKIRK